MITQTVTIPALCAWINANDRLHWHKKAELTALWREVAGWAVRQHRPVAHLQRAHVDVVMWFRTAHTRDAANYHPTVKAVIDGLVKDGGMLPDDNDQHMTGPMLFTGSPADRPSPKFVGLRVTFRELQQLATGSPDRPGGTGVTLNGEWNARAKEGSVLDSGCGIDRGASAHGAAPVEGGAM